MVQGDSGRILRAQARGSYPPRHTRILRLFYLYGRRGLRRRGDRPRNQPHRADLRNPLLLLALGSALVGADRLIGRLAFAVLGGPGRAKRIQALRVVIDELQAHNFHSTFELPSLMPVHVIVRRLVAKRLPLNRQEAEPISIRPLHA